ncbi:Hypothetical protein FKW44_021513 [Caligus rogercresseyi]|uniref:Uncharacterized protein n=1 Tax=Caligus rogercresseyi TaxID=217165 RepID=A0A7T8GRC8_CALRO|nr:Hypothetical protein FKW44_021513 [Caligus rogercresseyi]
MEEIKNLTEDEVARKKGIQRFDSLRTSYFIAKLQKKVGPRLEKVCKDEGAYFK